MNENMTKRIIGVIILFMLFGIKSCFNRVINGPEWPKGPDAYKTIEKWDRSTCQKMYKKVVENLKNKKATYEIMEVKETSGGITLTYKSDGNVRTDDLDYDETQKQLLKNNHLKAIACLCDKIGRRLTIQFYQQSDFGRFNVDLPYNKFK